MTCAWDAYLNLLPIWMRQTVDKQGRGQLLELRVRIGQPPQMITVAGNVFLEKPATREDLSFSINVASRYSAWATESVKHGYITAAGGHRIGICGRVAAEGGKILTMQVVTSLCIRVARDLPGISKGIENFDSLLIIGSPGSGKTTLLRDLIRRQQDICVIDEREELFPRTDDGFSFATGESTDVLSGCGKSTGLDIALRTMNPKIIALDEITEEADCRSLIHAGWCGVRLIATAHAGSKKELLTRPIYKPLMDSCLFDTLIVLTRDKSWHEERIFT